MSAVMKQAGIAGTFTLTFSIPPDAPPTVTIFSDEARTVVAVAAQVAVATANPLKWTAAYPASLVAGTYYLLVEYTSSTIACVDDDDVLILVPASVSVNGTHICTPWTTSAAAAACCGADIEEEDVLAGSIAAASEVLNMLSGQQFPGECSATVRPCWSVGSCGCIPSSCGCLTNETRLKGATSVTQVRIDGEILDPSEYRLDPGGHLVRLAVDGVNQGLPCCQRLDLPPTEEGTWEIAYLWGKQPPEMGKIAAAALACEFTKACTPGQEGKCRLPQRTTTLVRQGVTIQLSDLTALLDKGRTGIYEVDLFLASYNPSQLRRPPRVASPDIPPHRLVN